MRQCTEKEKYILAIILVTFFLRGFFLAAIFPIFKGQDESRHYNTIQYFSENWQQDCQNIFVDENGEEHYTEIDQKKEDLSTYRYSDEIKETTLVAQTKKIRGNSYDKIAFLNGFNGQGEEKFKLNKHSKVQHFCPPDVAYSAFSKDAISLYHRIGAFWEKVLKNKNIFIRYYFLRLFSVLLGTLTILMAYFIFKSVGFAVKSSLLLTAVISFQPKLSIYFTNINYDALLIFLWTAFILLGVRAIKYNLTLYRILFLLLIIFLAIITKPSAAPLLVLFIYLFIVKKYKVLREKAKTKWFYMGISLLGAGIIFVFYLLFKKINFISFMSGVEWNGLFTYLTKSLPKIYGSSHDYWGAISWSVNNLSLYYVKIIWLIEFVVWLGVLVLLGAVLSKKYFKKIFNKLNLKLIYKYNRDRLQFVYFALMAIALLQLGIRFADWNVFVNEGSLVLGTPGRYWLPNIVPHFVILAVGLDVIILFALKSREKTRKYFNLSLKLFLVIISLYWFYEVFDIIIIRFYM